MAIPKNVIIDGNVEDPYETIPEWEAMSEAELDRDYREAADLRAAWEMYVDRQSFFDGPDEDDPRYYRW